MRRAALALLLFAAPAPAADRPDLWTADAGGYAMYRIPGLIVTPGGSLVAYCEARKAAGDWAAIDIVSRRSDDGGKTWSPSRVLVSVPGPHRKNPAAVAKKYGDAVTYHNPVMIADAKGNAVHLLFGVEYERVFHCTSGDDGRTFSPPREVTATFDQFRPEYAWAVCATGPGHGIALRTGRLVVPVWLSTGTGGGAHRPSVVATVYSDDAGQTWHRGQIAATETDPLVNPNETTAAELSDGRVMLNIRHESPRHRRATSVSNDGATAWSRPTFDEALQEPICMGSLLAVPGGLLFSNPDVPKGRANLTVRFSPDDGATWPHKLVIDPGIAGYSDLAVGKDRTCYCLYERGATDGKTSTRTAALTLVTFRREQVTAEP